MASAAKHSAHYETAPEDRIPALQKFAYGMGSMANDSQAAWIGQMVAILILGLGISPALVGLIGFIPRIFDGILDHHEKWDGSGYPRGLVGESISYEGRLLALCDVYDALTSKREYRETMKWTPKKTLGLINDNLGTHFDPVLGQKFLDFMCERYNVILN